MEGYVSALDEEPDAEESPSSSETTLEMAQDGTVREKNTLEDEAQAHSPKPEIAPLEDTLLHLHNLDLGWMHAFRQGSVAEPDVSPTYQNPFGEIEDEAQAHSPTKAQTKAKPKTNCQAQTMAMPKTKGKAKNKAKTKPTSKAKTKAKPKTKGKAKKKAKPKPTSKAKTKGKAKTKAKAEVAQWKVYKHCQGCTVAGNIARSSLQ